MKRTFNTIMMAAAFGGIIILSSCNKDDDPAPVPNTITNVVVNSASFSVLEEAVVKANLATTLSGTGPFTVFAPDNAAFASAGITSATVTALTATQLSDLLLYHTLSSKIPAASVPAGPNAKVTTVGGDSVFVTRNATGVYVNGIKVAVADIAADNGVIHQLSKALNKPSGTIVQTAIATSGGDNGLDSLVVAVTAAGLGTTLSGSVFTVFAPTNKAFRELLTTLGLPRVSAIPLATLTAVLTYHVTAASNPSGPRVFSSDLANGNLTMLAGGNTTINLTNGVGGGPSIKGNGNGANVSTILAANIMCRNGVVHVIDKVLLP